MKKENRVVGILGVACHSSNFNADFQGYPRSNNKGFIASHASMKYPMRRYMEELGHQVFYSRRQVPVKGKGGVRDLVYVKLKESYECLFDTKLKKNNKAEVAENLLKCADVHNHGVTFAEEGNNMGIAGAVQITDGINIYDEASVCLTETLSPFISSEEKQNTSIGDRAVLDEAHFVFGFNVNPRAYDYLEDLIDGFEGYQEEMYQIFKAAALAGVSLQYSASKAGCANEFGLFVNFKNNSLANLANLHMGVNFYKEEEEDKEFNIFDLTDVFKQIEHFKEEIESVEIYYNEVTSKLKYPEIEDLKVIEKTIFI